MDRFRASGIDVHAASTPIELAQLCNRSEYRDVAEEIIGGLVAQAGRDEVACLTVLVALRPALIRIARRLARGGITSWDVQSDVVVAAWQAVIAASESPVSTSAARRVVVATWSACRTESRRTLRSRLSEEVLADSLDPADRNADPADRVSTLLVDACRQGVVSRHQAVLIHDTRVLDRSINELAAASGTSPAALRKQRRRIEATLRGFATEIGTEVIR
jgi:DNA-directed RNA polymerase specialized sigma24 family protein